MFSNLLQTLAILCTASAIAVQAAPTTDVKRELTEVSQWANNTLEARANVFKIDYRDYPQSAENICFSWHCNNGPRSVAPNRAASTSNRKLNSCGNVKTNRCSKSFKPPHASGYQCDEWPWAASSGGGAGAATRCIPASDNGGSGSAWGNYINNKGPQAPGKVLQDKVDFVTIQVTNIPQTATFCKGELPGGKITQQECTSLDKGQPYLQQRG